MTKHCTNMSSNHKIMTQALTTCSLAAEEPDLLYLENAQKCIQHNRTSNNNNNNTNFANIMLECSPGDN